MNKSRYNPDFEHYVNGIVKGDIAVLSRAITLAESTKIEHRDLINTIIEALLPFSGKSVRLGITGVPGVGKSTFIESFGQVVLEKGHKLAVLAVDPSSTKTKGSILGDKTRMEKLSANENVFIRPSPSAGTLGGLSRATYESIVLCEAAGFDYIIIETVGVGQSETAVSKLCDFFLLLMLAGAGDELQGIKRGIMEMADGLIITKADGSNEQKAKLARAEYANAMHMLQLPESGWIPRVQTCSSMINTGIEEAYKTINDYVHQAHASNYFFEKRKTQKFDLFLDALDDLLRNNFYLIPEVKQMLDKIKLKENIHPYTEAMNIWRLVYEK